MISSESSQPIQPNHPPNFTYGYIKNTALTPLHNTSYKIIYAIKKKKRKTDGVIKIKSKFVTFHSVIEGSNTVTSLKPALPDDDDKERALEPKAVVKVSHHAAQPEMRQQGDVVEFKVKGQQDKDTRQKVTHGQLEDVPVVNLSRLRNIGCNQD